MPNATPIMEARTIDILRTVTLASGGFLVVWREPDGAQQHNTFSLNPNAWIAGYQRGESLEQLQNIKANDPH